MFGNTSINNQVFHASLPLKIIFKAEWKTLCCSFLDNPNTYLIFMPWGEGGGGVKATLTFHDPQTSDCNAPGILVTTSQNFVWVYSCPVFKMPTFCGIFCLWFCCTFSIFIWFLSLHLLQKTSAEATFLFLFVIQLLREETRGHVVLISSLQERLSIRIYRANLGCFSNSAVSFVVDTDFCIQIKVVKSLVLGERGHMVGAITTSAAAKKSRGVVCCCEIGS